jgi:hypothetical protein
VYIGSTIQPLSKRMGGHRTKFKSYCVRSCNYVSSFDVLEIGDAYIELVEYCSCGTKAELERREGEVQRDTNCVNKHIAGRTPSEYRTENKDKLKAWRAKHYAENKDKLKAWRAKHYAENKDKLKAWQAKYYDENKDKIKTYKSIYRAENKDKIKTYKSIYRAENKDKIKEYLAENRVRISARARENIDCECGTEVSRGALSNHRRSKKHKQWQEIHEFIMS